MFRFTIRDVLWLTVVVALAVGWFLDSRTETARNQEALNEIRAESQRTHWIAVER